MTITHSLPHSTVKKNHSLPDSTVKKWSILCRWSTMMVEIRGWVAMMVEVRCECFRRWDGGQPTNQPCWQSGDGLIIPFYSNQNPPQALFQPALITCCANTHNNGGEESLQNEQEEDGFRKVPTEWSIYMRHRAHSIGGQFDNRFVA